MASGYKVYVSSRGFSLLETMIALGAMGAMALALTSTIVSQQKEIRGLEQKQEMIDLKNVMLQQLVKPEVCSWQLKNKLINVSMPTSSSSPSPTTIQLPALYDGTNTSSAVLAKAGQKLPTSFSGLVVDHIEFKNIYATGNPNEYMGTFEVSFKSSSLAQKAAAPVQVNTVFQTTPGDPLTGSRISGCNLKDQTPTLKCGTYVIAQYVDPRSGGWTYNTRYSATDPSLTSSQAFNVSLPGPYPWYTQWSAWKQRWAYLECKSGYYLVSCQGGGTLATYNSNWTGLNDDPGPGPSVSSASIYPEIGGVGNDYSRKNACSMNWSDFWQISGGSLRATCCQ